MKLLQRYILIEFLGPFLFSLIGLTLVLMMGNLVRLADLVISKGVSLYDVFLLFLYLAPYLLTFSLPMAILLGTLLAYGRLSADNEITAMRASGVSLFTLASPVLLVGLLISLGAVYFNDQILPKARYESRKLLAEIGIKNPTAYLESGTFIRAFDGYILFIHAIHGNELSNVRIYQLQEGKQTRTIFASRAEFVTIPETDTVKLKLMDGMSDEPNPRDPTNIYKLHFETYYLTLTLSEDTQKKQIHKKPKDMTIGEIQREITLLRQDEVNTAPLETEFHRKFALAFANFFLILIGFPMALITHRGERMIGFVMGIGIVTLYYILLAFGNALSLRETLPASVAIWIPNGLISLLGLVLIKRVMKV